jgi:hypothetical protein
MNPEEQIHQAAQALECAMMDVYATLPGLIAILQARLDLTVAQLKIDDRDEIKRALAGQCVRLRQVLNELAQEISEQRPVPTETLAIIGRSERAIAALQASAASELGGGNRAHHHV